MDEVVSFYQYWGKAQKGDSVTGDAYHLLPYHCLDVAAVGYQFLALDKPLTQDLAAFLEITPKQLRDMVAFALALHDFGKFANAFQRLYSSESQQLYHPEKGRAYDSHDYRHDRLGLFFWTQLEDLFWDKIEYSSGQKSQSVLNKLQKSWMVLMHCVLGHHGQPVEDRLIRSMCDFTEPHNVQAARLWLDALFELLPLDLPLTMMVDKGWRKRFKQVSWHLAGIAVLSDWIGSNQDYFIYQSQVESLNSYWDRACHNAALALHEFGLEQHQQVGSFQSVQTHFGFFPTPLQAWAEQVEVDAMPHLFILEDITGSGKTEAALTLVHRLMASGAADGFYFGLPTMATSNAMFSRVVKHYAQMYDCHDNIPDIVLAHGARDMNEQFQQIKFRADTGEKPYESGDQTATAQCNTWLADSRKKALLAPVGVGTIDQALMAVLPRRHQSLRLLGMNRKILIFDEIHAADDYMFELLEGLLKLHFHQGGSVILLTATLPLKQRQRLVNIWRSAAGLPEYPLQKTDFPLATYARLRDCPREIKLESRASVKRRVDVKFLHHQHACLDVIRQAVANEQCVVWVRNSVQDALDAYQLVQSIMDHSENCILFHSRFTLLDRQKIEHNVLDILGKTYDHAASLRAGKVLISTQIFQESLDADADVMISDLCPIDDLIQRAGRLRRHIRDAKGNYLGEGVDQRGIPVLCVHAPLWDEHPSSDWLSRDFQNTEYVYRSPGRLWLGQQILQQLGAIRMPEDARTLIEAVYRDDQDKNIPENLLSQEMELMGDERAKASRAWSLLFDYAAGYCPDSSDFWHEDIGDIGTRYTDIETVDVLVLKKTNDEHCIPYAGTIPFTIPLSTIKVPKKAADRLALVDDALVEKIQQHYRGAQFLQCWLPELDEQFCYNAEQGFYEQTPQ
ncbi:MAG: CRISPR-associated endonuclease/helicase Cas3 [Candidatus Celerinatantimonas neptuna]|nr:MAG: CRISPR-associated endonuclease/helicase Cas3 [Candidatus Celerinatantimonas neptuna]